MANRLKPPRIEHVVDGERLRAQLTAAALDNIGDEAGARRRALQLLSGALFRGRMIAQEWLEDGGRGMETARLLSAVQDEVIAALWDFTTVHVFRSRNPTKGERLCVVAVGGYGRGELAPSSDIDLLFLRAYKQTAWAESVIEYMLYMLWDMGLKVGHSSRTIEECLKLAREDHTIATAILDARILSGDEKLFGELMQRYRGELIPGQEAVYAQAKLSERDDRHSRSGASRYLVEPNLKDGKGGLRDLHTIGWIAKFIYGVMNEDDFVRLDIFTRDEIIVMRRAADFLWTVRCHIHYLTGRGEERIAFDLQPEMARRLGYRDGTANPGVERFMKRYFEVVRDVGRLTRIFAAKLEADGEKFAPRGLGRFRAKPSPDQRRVTLADAPEFVIDGGRLSVMDPDSFKRHPSLMMRLFEIADQMDKDVHPAALAAVTRNLNAVPGIRRDAAAIESFLNVISSRHHPAAALQLMNETGLLGKFLPEFGHVVARTQFNMYHHFTVDEHTLRAVDYISEIEHGRREADHPLATQIFPQIAHRRALYLAMLLHDTGKGKGDQQIEGEVQVRSAGARLGLPHEEIDLTAWLVRHHLLMSDTAQKRDLSDPRTITDFADAVQTPEKLRLLLVLTIADIKAVGEGVWNSWKAQLLRDLFRLTEAAFRGGRAAESAVQSRLAERAQESRAAVEAAFPPASSGALQAWLQALEDAYWLGFDTSAHLWHARELHAHEAQPIFASARPDPRRGVTDVQVKAPDRAGLFVALTGALASEGASVVDARIYTSKAGEAFDVFSLQDWSGQAFGADDPHRLARLIRSIELAAAGDEQTLAREITPPKKPSAFSIEPLVVADNSAATDCTVLEVSGRDRAGLLRDLARVLAQNNCALKSAHVESVGERAVDAFYVHQPAGGKIEDPAQLEKLKAALMEALLAYEPAAPMTPARRVMARAPASAGR